MSADDRAGAGIPEAEGMHRWVHEQMGAYLAGGLDARERAALDAHIHECAACFEAFSEARGAHLEVLRRLGAEDTGLTAGPELEDRLVKHFREATMKRNSLARLAGMSIAAAVGLAATGVLANHLVRQDRLNNPLTERLTAQLPLPGWMGGTAGPTTAPAKLTNFHFDRANPETVLNYLASAGGYRIIKPETGVQGPPITIGSPAPVTPAQAVEALNVALQADGYTMTEAGDRTLKVQPVPDAKRIASVRYGSDPSEVPDTDNTITQVIPIVGADAATVVDKLPLGPTADRSVNRSTNSIVITDSGKDVRKALESIPDANRGKDLAVGSADAARTKSDLAPQVTLFDGQRSIAASASGKGGNQSFAMSGTGTLNLSGDFNRGTQVSAGSLPVNGGLIAGNTGGKTFAGDTSMIGGALPAPITPDAWDQQLRGTTGGPGSTSGGVGGGSGFGKAAFFGGGGGRPGNINLYDQPTYAQQNINQMLADEVVGALKKRVDPGTADGHAEFQRKADFEISNDNIFQQSSNSSMPLIADVPVTGGTPFTPTTQPAAPPPPSAAAPDVAARKVIRNGTVEYEVRSFDDAYQTISSLTTELGGFVSSTSSDRLTNGKIRGTVVVRVPPEKLDKLLLQLRGIGELKNQQIAANDVTKEYVDTQSELRGLRAMEDRMLDLIKNGKGEVKDLVEAEKQLGDYRVRIEKLEGEIRYYDNLVAMATLTITAYERDIQKAAAATEQETASIDLQTETVEEKLAAARKLIDDAKGRVIDGGAKKGDNDQITAYLAADIPADKSDSVLAGLRVLGQVVHFERTRKQTLSGGGGGGGGGAATSADSTAADAPGLALQQKDTRITLTLSNLASVPPHETISMNLAVADVPAAYQALLAALRGGDAVPPATQPQAPGAMGPVGRVITSQVTGNRPEEITGNIQAEVRAQALDKILTLLRDQGLVLGQNVTQNSNGSATTEKEGLNIQILSAATVPPRETTAINVAAADVPALYAALLSTLHGPPGAAPAAAPGRVTNSQLAGNKPTEMSAVIQGDISTADLPKLLALLHDQGALLAQTVSQNTNAATMPTKEGLSIQIVSAATIPPRRVTTLGIEVGSASEVTRGLDHVRAALPAAGPAGAKILEDAVSSEGNGRLTGRLTADVPVADALKVLSAIHDLGGDEKVDNVQINADAPDTQYATERISLSLSSRGPIVESNQGIWPTMRAALSSALAALSWSLYLVLTGILFLLPWALILWVLRKLWKRRAVA
ncbi:MAG TPA: DUF4349 domain-containing protein [Phycisphaerae bacterium]|nr:DUF4349 domain-containing protein [Phycisphaerae bacterium]